MKEVGIIGVGQSAFTRSFDGSIRELAFEAFREAINDAKMFNLLIITWLLV